MIVLIVLFGSWLLFRAAGALGVQALAPWVTSCRWALAVMLLFTASAHFTKMRDDLLRMVPQWVPWPKAMVAFTGVCEILGAIGILLPQTRQLAGILLILFFIMVFPANIRAAKEAITLAGRPATQLWLRLPMQLLFIGLIWWVTGHPDFH
jgi:uncharacterized membrane protein